jgi:hypothetical protein
METGRPRPYFHGIVVAEPQHSKIWVADLPEVEGLHRLLHHYHEFHTRLVIHADPIYVSDACKHGNAPSADHRIDRLNS